jgi:hypothetical protein
MTDAILAFDAYSGLRSRRANERAADTSDKEGTLRMMASGRWAVCRAGREPVEITSGERFRVEVADELKLTRMGYDDGYYSVDGYPLFDGLRAAIVEHGQKFRRCSRLFSKRRGPRAAATLPLPAAPNVARHW